MPQFPLAKFLERFGIFLTVTVALALTYSIGNLVFKWAESEQKTRFPSLRRKLRQLFKWEQQMMDEYWQRKKSLPRIYSPYDPTMRITVSFQVGVVASFLLMWILYTTLTRLSHLHQKMLTGAVFIGALGAILFWMKVKQPLAYAVIEVTIALLLAANTMAGLRDNITPIETLTLLTSAYLIVRGLDNFRSGRKAALEEQLKGRTI